MKYLRFFTTFHPKGSISMNPKTYFIVLHFQINLIYVFIKKNINPSDDFEKSYHGLTKSMSLNSVNSKVISKTPSSQAGARKNVLKTRTP
jgi:hypothetical protein